jgi:hypothetical protein
VIRVAHPFGFVVEVCPNPPVFPTTDRALTYFPVSNVPNIGYPPFPYTAFIYADAAGAVVFEYTANIEYAVLGNEKLVFENA